MPSLTLPYTEVLTHIHISIPSVRPSTNPPIPLPPSRIGVDLSKYWWEQIKILGEKMVIADEIMGVSQLWVARARAAPKIYACALWFSIHSYINPSNYAIEGI